MLSPLELGKLIRERMPAMAEAVEAISARMPLRGDPVECLTKIAGLWSAAFEYAFSPSDVALAMILVKVGRETQGAEKDNATDIAGYAELLRMCQAAEDYSI